MPHTATTDRREFLRSAGLGAAAAAATAAAAAAAGRRIPSGTDEAAPERSSGYRASPHILKYYRTAEV